MPQRVVARSAAKQPDELPLLDKIRKTIMALEIWLPGLFLLGLVSMGACFLFMAACENI
jgi:hypothetical protein